MAAHQSFSKVRVKEEKDDDFMAGHLHHFTFRTSKDTETMNIECTKPRTVLEALKSSRSYNELKFSDENIVIQLGKADKEAAVATHFPCTCIEEGESLIISCKSQKVEEAQQPQTIQSRDQYSVFYIHTKGGTNAKTKNLFRNNAVKTFDFVCVYGEKGMTVKEALKRDGRFIDNLGDFKLFYIKDKSTIEDTYMVDKLEGEKFKIRLPKNRGANNSPQNCDTASVSKVGQKTGLSVRTPNDNPGASNHSQQKHDAESVFKVVQQRGLSVRTAVDKSSSAEEIYQKLREQFPGLKEWMESRYPDDSYQGELDLKKENFGKIQQSFSEVHRVRKLLKLGNSVCKVVVGDVCEGTGFVLFDNFILTNAHIFKGCAEGGKLREGIDVSVFFNYEDPEPRRNYNYFQLAHPDMCYSDDELDYAILELNPEGQNAKQTPQTKKIQVPPGLLKEFGDLPLNGEACIIGHPAGGLKKMDPTCIIEKENRNQSVSGNLRPYKDNKMILYIISEQLKEKGIERIMMGGNKADKVVTYNTFMYHGASGSPVFDAGGKVFGLHTAGYVSEFRNLKGHVIEFAQPLLTIFNHFVSQLKAGGKEELLKRIEEKAKGNSYLEKVLKESRHEAEQVDPEERSDRIEPMEIS